MFLYNHDGNSKKLYFKRYSNYLIFLKRQHMQIVQKVLYSEKQPSFLFFPTHTNTHINTCNCSHYLLQYPSRTSLCAYKQIIHILISPPFTQLVAYLLYNALCFSTTETFLCQYIMNILFFIAVSIEQIHHYVYF